MDFFENAKKNIEVMRNTAYYLDSVYKLDQANVIYAAANALEAIVNETSQQKFERVTREFSEILDDPNIKLPELKGSDVLKTAIKQRKATLDALIKNLLNG